jgi:hypothetical protein
MHHELYRVGVGAVGTRLGHVLETPMFEIIGVVLASDARSAAARVW